MPLRRILQLGVGEPEIDIFVVLTVLDVREKAANDRRGNHVGHALRDVSAISLERHADHLRILHDRATAVPGIDLRANLDREMLVN